MYMESEEKMTIIKIEPASNGAHANQTLFGALRTVPVGWAVVSDALEDAVRPLLPWVKLTVENGIVTAAEADTEAKTAWEAEKAALEAADGEVTA